MRNAPPLGNTDLIAFDALAGRSGGHLGLEGRRRSFAQGAIRGNIFTASKLTAPSRSASPTAAST
jgi:hypothetical protein